LSTNKGSQTLSRHFSARHQPQMRSPAPPLRPALPLPPPCPRFLLRVQQLSTRQRLRWCWRRRRKGRRRGAADMQKRQTPVCVCVCARARAEGLLKKTKRSGHSRRIPNAGSLLTISLSRFLALALSRALPLSPTHTPSPLSLSQRQRRHWLQHKEC